MIAIVNYGLGNIEAFANILRRKATDVRIAQAAEDLVGAAKIILPGVGSFDTAMSRLNASGMRDALDEQVLRRGTPVLGVCVGMQMMARGSDEGELDGLGWIPGEVRKLVALAGDGSPEPLPHMGWNDVCATSAPGLFDGMEDPTFYFLHSYVLVPDDESDVHGVCTYGSRFTAAVRRGNIFGTQFHPEKSHDWGVRLLTRFVEM